MNQYQVTASYFSKTKTLETIHEELSRLGKMKMRYRGGANNTEIGDARLFLSMATLLRFGMTSPSIIASLYNINTRQAREHLQKLMKKGLASKVTTFRSSDGMVYVPTFSGAKFVEQRLNIPMHYRRPREGKPVNFNNLMHDLLNQFVLLKLQEKESSINLGYYAYTGLITEKETKRILGGSERKIVDGMLAWYCDTSMKYRFDALEFEHGTKSYGQRAESLIRYKAALRSGIYQKIILVSHDRETLKDAQRINNKCIENLTSQKQTKSEHKLTGQDAELLERCIEYCDDFCDELTHIFYRSSMQNMS